MPSAKPKPLERTYRSSSAEERRAERRARLIEAGYDVLASEGAARTTMKAVRIRSGLTERYFYESFKDCDELLTTLVDLVGKELRAAILLAVATAPNDLYSLSHAAASAVVDLLAKDPRKARVYREATRGGHIKASKTAYVESLARELAERLQQVPGLQAKRLWPKLYATEVMLLFAVSETTAVWLDGDIDLTRDQLIDQFAKVCTAAICTLDGRLWRR
jgi:AcrR family transcriptional regulator